MLGLTTAEGLLIGGRSALYHPVNTLPDQILQGPYLITLSVVCVCGDLWTAGFVLKAEPRDG